MNKIQNFFQICILITQNDFQTSPAPVSSLQTLSLKTSGAQRPPGSRRKPVALETPEKDSPGVENAKKTEQEEKVVLDRQDILWFTALLIGPQGLWQAAHKILEEQQSARASKNRHQRACVQKSPTSAGEGSHPPHPLASSRQDLSVDTVASRSPWQKSTDRASRTGGEGPTGRLEAYAQNRVHKPTVFHIQRVFSSLLKT